MMGQKVLCHQYILWNIFLAVPLIELMSLYLLHLDYYNLRHLCYPQLYRLIDCYSLFQLKF